MNELAKSYGCSTQPIVRALDMSGTQRRKGGSQKGDPSPNRRFTDEQDKQIAAEYEAGASIRAIAEKWNAPAPKAVHNSLKRSGVERRSRAPNLLFGPVEQEAIAAEYLAGKGMEALASEYGCTAAPIRGILKRRGIESRRSGQRKRELPEEQVAEIVRRYEAGESQQSIADSYGFSQGWISRVLRAAGVKTRMWAEGPEAHGAWKGGHVKIGEGYVGIWVAPDDPLASMRLREGYVLEHRLVMARHLGRPLTRTETVHHINGDKTDNRLENLQLRQGKHGSGHAYRCADCGSRNVVADPLV
jgi:Mor family transcriptional regulator